MDRFISRQLTKISSAALPVSIFYPLRSVNSGSGQSTSVSSAKYIVFTPDGHYQKSGFTAVSFSSETASSASRGDTDQENRKYLADSYRATLIRNGGSPKQHTLRLGSASSTSKVMFVDDVAFLR